MVVSRPLLYKIPTPDPPLDEVGYLTLTRDCFFPTNTVTYNDQQRVGIGWDGTIGDNKVELKDDLASGDTGNLFIETGQRWGSDWQPSGLALSVDQADIYLVVGHVGHNAVVFGFHPTSFFDYVKTCRRVETHPGANGNRPGHYARGRLVPFRGAEGIALTKFLIAIPTDSVS